MEQIRQSKFEYERMRLDYEKDEEELGWNAVKEREYELQKREKELERQFKDIVRNDPHNAEILYRNGYYLMVKERFIEAIQLFERALAKNKRSLVTYPLSEDQVIKAHMYKGYCAGHIVKESLAKVNELNVEEIQFDFENVEGKSLDEVLEMLKNQSEHYLAYYNGKKQSLSLEEYLKFKAGENGEVLLISFIEPEDIFVKLGSNEPKKLTVGLSEKLRFMVDTIIKFGEVTWQDLQDQYGDQPWESFRKTKDRINNLVRENGISILKIPEGKNHGDYPKKFQLATDNYIIVFRQTDFMENF